MKIHKHLAIIAVALVLPFAAANAAVNLVFDQASVSVLPGGQFDVTLSIEVTNNEQVSGFSTLLAELSSAGFFIVSRDRTGSPFSDPQTADTTVDDRPDYADLNPTTGDSSLTPSGDLGAGTPSGATSGNSTFFTGTYTIGLDGVAPGTYTISTTGDFDGTGPSFWADETQGENDFDNEASIVITVVPEPATWSLIALGGLGAIGMNLLRARRKS